MKSKAILVAAALAIVMPFGVAMAKDNEALEQVKERGEQKVAEVETGNSTTEQESEALKTRVEEAREAAKARVESAREAAKERKIALKQDRCEAQKDKLTERLPRLSQSVTSVKKVLDAKYEKVIAINKSGKLTVSNFDELDAEIKVKQQSAQTAVDNIDPATFAIDCNNNDLGVQLDSYRATVNEAKTALKGYRTALVNLVSALNASADKAEVEANDSTGAKTEANTEGVN